MATPQPTTRGEARWRRAYTITLANAAVFLLLALFSRMLGITSIPINAGIALIFLIGSVISAALLSRAGEGLAAIAFYVAGAGVLFGFGTFYATLRPLDETSRLLFPESTQQDLLGTINLVNAVSVMCVLVFAAPARLRMAGRATGLAVLQALKSLAAYTFPMVIASTVIVALEVVTFPVPENLMLRSIMAVLSRLPLATVILVFAGWSQANILIRILTSLITVALILLGILTTAKTTALLPMIAVIAGLWLDKGTRRVAIVGAVACVVAYFMVLAPLSQVSRRNANYSGGGEGLSASIENLRAGANSEQPKSSSLSLLNRFSAAPYQAYLIQQYQNGERGHSLDDFWVALVPRVLWEDKPNVTRYGGELFGQINKTTDVSSALAPTYSAEAYWNYGWPGVLIVSALVGLELGWLTQKWLDLITGRAKSTGILVMAIPVALYGFWVETWVVPTYIGGFVTLVIMIKGIDVGVRFLEQHRLGPLAKLTPKRLRS